MSTTDAPDCPAFATIYRALNGQLTNLTDSNCCQWSPRNVNCSTIFDKTLKRNISSINQIIFTEKDIAIKGGSMSPLLGQLKSLISLQLRFLGLTGQIPPLPQQFAVLLLEGNQLTGPVPDFQFNVTNVAGLTKPYFNITNNQFGKQQIPASVASVDFSVGLSGSQCPFDTNMCATGPVTSCPGVAFTCQANAVPTTTLTTPTTPPTLNQDPQADTVFGINKNVAYGVAGGIGALLILIVAAFAILGGRKKVNPPSAKSQSVGTNFRANNLSNAYPAPISNSGSHVASSVYQQSPPQLFSPSVLLGQPGAPIQLTGTTSNEYQSPVAQQPRIANYESPSLDYSALPTSNYSTLPSSTLNTNPTSNVLSSSHSNIQPLNYNYPGITSPINSNYLAPKKVCLNCNGKPITHIVSPCNHEIFCAACAELNAEGGIW
ncbi:hypothetical protein HK103_007586 [Boothiomyces macroporosus]|uniref:Uncharacterized protein n=1 Tax=Boothiomyces macroporosus TaxID=261099 RepID=A0AAD5UCD1_9FUNG|nr:hypothetical protein HK103_007586 [Boothiomyces macroporosus]